MQERAARGGESIGDGKMTTGMLRWALFGALLLAAGPTAAQDALKSAPGVFNQVLDTPRVRILEGAVKPGTKTPIHAHPDHVIYMLSEGTIVVRPAGRTPYELPLERGQALLLPAQQRAIENDGPGEIRVLIVELKPGAAAAPGRSGATRKKGKGKASSRGRKGTGKARRK